MRFVSYAQNFEDVMLWRALKHVPAGFYIDIGANDPLRDSVTKAFYDRGWRGVNVEPVATHFADLQRDRPRDVNLQCAVGDSNGTIEFWEWDTEGLATAAPEVVQQHLAEGHTGGPRVVPLRTLASVCDEHAGGDIHFLKVDVEGGEQEVLAGADFSRFRPWIVVIEATRPNSTEHIHQDWEHFLTSAGYAFVYDDGLNRFYLAAEHEELRTAFAYPPNIFDGFIVAQQFNAEQALKELERAVQQLHARVATLAENVASANEQVLRVSQQAAEHAARAARAETQLEHELETARRNQQALAARQSELKQALTMRDAELEQARLRIQQIHASSSWRVTAPLRRVAALVKGEPPVHSVMSARQPQASRGAAEAPVEGEVTPPIPLSPRATGAYAHMKKAAEAARKPQ